MSMLDDLRAAADFGRQATDELGIRTVTVSVVVQSYTASRNTLGATPITTTTLVLSPRPKVVAEGDGEASGFGGGDVAESAGVLRATTYRIGPISRAYSNGGYNIAQILATPSSPSQRVYVVLDDGGDQFASGGEKFSVTSADTTRPLQLTVTVQRSDQGA